MKGHYLGEVKFIKIVQEKDGFSLLIEIDEGPQFKIGNIILNNFNLLLSNEKFLKIFKIKKGDIFNNELINFYKHKIKEFYHEKAYLQAQINFNYIVNEDDLSIDIEVNIVEGNPIHIRHIEIINNDTTKFHIIDQELEIFEGELFNSKKIRSSIINLNNTRFFSFINPIIQPTNYENLIDLKLDIKEERTGLITLGLTYNPEESVGGNLNYNQPNFLGSGWNVSIKLSGSQRSANVDLGGSTKWLLPYMPLQFDTNIGYHFRKAKVNSLIKKYLYDKDKNYEYTHHDFSLNIQFGYPIIKQVILYTGTAFSIYHLSNPTFLLSYLDNSKRSYRLKKDLSLLENKSFFFKISLFFGFLYDIRDLKVNTLNGVFLDNRFTLTGGIFYGDSHWIKYRSYSSFYYNPFWKIVLSLHIRYETLFKQFTGQFEVRDKELLSFQYASEIRGWNTYTNNSIKSAGSKISLSLEKKIPLFQKLLASILFFDLGDIGEKAPSFPTQIRYYSFGFGFEIQIPGIGYPLLFFFAKRFDYNISKPGDVYLHNSFDLIFSLAHFL
uniref:Outer membrane protein assembly factor n=1 Tax=uncultured spirochete TaxID=156406 RepID=A0A224ATA8_9SPIR|nr:outer membrane protein assembly factor [uncultured spirochete]